MALDLTTYIPDRKFVAGGIFGIAAWGIELLVKHFGVEIPVWVDAALPLAIGKAASYLAWPSAQDVIKRINGDLAAAAGYMPIPSAPAAKLRAETVAPSLPLDPATAETLRKIQATTPVLVPKVPAPSPPPMPPVG